MGKEKTVELLDNLKNMGYKYSTRAGISISLGDMLIPKEKYEIIEQAKKEVKDILEQAQMGVITETERYNKVIICKPNIWSGVSPVQSWNKSFYFKDFLFFPFF